jgi:hypothetical protein
MYILLVEDDPRIARVVERALAERTTCWCST